MGSARSWLPIVLLLLVFVPKPAAADDQPRAKPEAAGLSSRGADATPLK
jgi:hypothetical protein